MLNATIAIVILFLNSALYQAFFNTNKFVFVVCFEQQTNLVNFIQLQWSTVDLLD